MTTLGDQESAQLPEGDGAGLAQDGQYVRLSAGEPKWAHSLIGTLLEGSLQRLYRQRELKNLIHSGSVRDAPAPRAVRPWSRVFTGGDATHSIICYSIKLCTPL